MSSQPDNQHGLVWDEENKDWYLSPTYWYEFTQQETLPLLPENVLVSA